MSDDEPIVCTLVQVWRRLKSATSSGNVISLGVREYGASGGRPIQPGDMFFDKKGMRGREHELSDYYYAHNTHRYPLFVVLPGNFVHLIDGKFWNRSAGYHGGWKVTGDAPLITVDPSIDIKGVWHGWLKSGVLRSA